MEETSTEALRKLAPSWTLAGDEQLLTILQNTHQKLLVKCQEANSQLEQMATVLCDATISLQNVNNRFMALSSSQFIESRVYDDDDVAIDTPEGKEPPKPEVQDELTSLKCSLSVLESAHEVMTILRDSDTESESDDDMPHRSVLKPKDVYASRPLPYIIGSQPWKNKWHAGLLLEDSDSDSSASKVDRNSDQYSQSEPEDMQTDTVIVYDAPDAISVTSSELPSEQGSVPKATPSDIANQIASRLGSREPPKMDREPQYYEPPNPAVRKVYRPQDPVTSTIFPDEPPPLSGSDSEGDIFAELTRSQPYRRSTAADDLFHDHDDSDGDIFNDFRKQPTNQPTSLFDAGPTPHMFDKFKPTPSDARPHAYDTAPNPEVMTASEDRGVKKPVGGISLFGNKGTESIGAAILKRNQRKSSTSDNDTGSDKTEPVEQNNKKEKDIFDDLFARSEGKKVTNKTDAVKEVTTEIKNKNEVTKVVEKPKIDLFSDNLFDDIDDIFSNNIVKMPSKDSAKVKPIFEDDDDLFSEIASPKPMKIEVASSSNKKLFDSDDDLFSDKVKKDVKSKTNQIAASTKVVESPKNDKQEITKTRTTKINETNKVLKETTQSIFDDDEDDIFSDLKVTKQNIVGNEKPRQENQNNLHNNIKETKHIETSKSSVFKSPSLFDDDDDNELFSEPTKPTVAVNHLHVKENLSKSEINKEHVEKNIVVSSSSQPVVEQSKVINKQDPKKNIAAIIDNNNKIDTAEKDKDSIYVSNVSKNVDSNLNTVQSKAVNLLSDHIKTVKKSSSDTDDDFEQDFDDLPPKVEVISKNSTNLVSEAEFKQVSTEKDNMFDNNTLQDDILLKPEQPQPIFENDVTIENKELEKTDKDNTNKEFIPNVEADIFSDILTEPPAFEKPKEPKKSKNVNALFDDDSDDESLFFKKNDVITDDKPEYFKPAQDRLFGIFTDEPPDDGFSKISDDLNYDMFNTLPKPKVLQEENLPPLPSIEDDKNVRLPKSENRIPAVDSNEDIFRTMPLPEKGIKPETSKTSVIDAVKLPKEETLISNKENVDKPPIKEKSTKLLVDEELLKSDKEGTNTSISKKLDILSDDDDIFLESKFKKSNAPLSPIERDAPKPVKQESPSTTSDNEIFKSPTKQKKIINEILKEDSKSVDDVLKIPHSEIQEKSEEIPEKAESKKVGKLKVGLNINVNALLPGASPKKVKPNDLTDGQTQSQNPDPESNNPENQNPDSKLIKSVSFDGKPDSEVLDNKISKERAKIQVKRRPSTRRARIEAVRKSAIDLGEDSTDNSSSIDDPPVIHAKNQPEVNKTDNIEDIPKIDQNIDKKSINSEVLSQNEQEKTIIRPESLKQVEKQAEIIEKPTFSKDVKSKVVYILNDEDIFNTKPIEKSEISKIEIAKPVNLVPNTEINTGITTLGKAYNKSETATNDSKKDKKSSLFDDDDDDEIFKGKTVEKKTNIFDSDSEGELFGTSKKDKRKETTKEIRKDVKASLFGDEEDDDDDLFGVKTKKIVEPTPQPSRSAVKDSVTTEPVFEDPLSMFGEDD